MAASPPACVSPPATHERREALDALRGAALLGVLLVNLVTEFRVPLLAWLTRFHTHQGILNHAAVTGNDLGRFVSTVGMVGLALAYISGFLLLATAWRGSAFVRAIARLGRMTLTSYLTQSAVFSLVFYGYGLGQFGAWGPAPVAAAGVAFYVSQVALSNAWLRRHRQGPVEGLWRRLSHGTLPGGGP